MSKSLIKDNTAYAGAIIILMSTIMISYVLFISVLPVTDVLKDSFETQLSDSNNQFFSETIEKRFDMARNLGWKAPIGFIAIGFIYCFVRVIKRQQYTKYTDNEY